MFSQFYSSADANPSLVLAYALDKGLGKQMNQIPQFDYDGIKDTIKRVTQGDIGMIVLRFEDTSDCKSVLMHV